MPFLILFIVLPVLELAVLIKVGGQIGVLSTIALIFLTALAGITIMRLQGFVTLLRARQRLAEGSLPAAELAEGFLLAMAGLLLLIPGFITDVLGALLLVPPLRRAMAGAALSTLQSNGNVRFRQAHYREKAVDEAADERAAPPAHPRAQIHIIDGEYRRED